MDNKDKSNFYHRSSGTKSMNKLERTNFDRSSTSKSQLINGKASDKSDNSETQQKVSDVKISNIIGDFGPYQISVVLFAALRAMACAMDGLSGPFISPNIRNYQCEICDISTSNVGIYGDSDVTSNSSSNGTCAIYFGSKERYELDSSHCYFSGMRTLKEDRVLCNKWTFNNSDNIRLMNSLTVEQSLVCDREWLKSLSNSMYFVGATFGLLFWGLISDRYGRKTAYVCSHFVTLIFGFSALFADSMCTFILLRSINAFGMIGELIPRSIQVEIVAAEYRFICSVICQIGWASGIILVPALAYLNPSYRFILAFPVVLTLIMLPWLIWLPESSRWLITNGKFQKARDELRRGARINATLASDTDSKIEQFNRQVLHDEVNSGQDHKRMGLWRSISAIFTNLHLLKDTLSVFVLLFVAEVVYFSLTLNVADLGGSLYTNYIISGLTELVSIAFCAFILAYLPRRMCLSILLLASTVSYLLMAVVNIYEESFSMTAILTVNAFGKLTAIGNLMVIILVSQEVFPTVIRQFGTSLCITVGKAGSAVAPFTHELGQIIGQSYCLAMFSVVCFLCALIPLGLSETGSRELPDTVGDVEEGIERRKRGDNSNKNNVAIKKNNNIAKMESSEQRVAHYESNKLLNSQLNLPAYKVIGGNHLVGAELEIHRNNDQKNEDSNRLASKPDQAADQKEQQKKTEEDSNNNYMDPSAIHEQIIVRFEKGKHENGLIIAAPNSKSVSNLSSLATSAAGTSGSSSSSDISSQQDDERSKK